MVSWVVDLAMFDTRPRDTAELIVNLDDGFIRCWQAFWQKAHILQKTLRIE